LLQAWHGLASPSFDAYVKYFKNAAFMDDFIMEALNGKPAASSTN
jgi:hypothetical protein